MRKHVFVFLISCSLYLVSTLPAAAAPTITGLSDNQNAYGGTIPKYEKFELTFNIANSVYTNYLFPYTDTPPPGINTEVNLGVTVTGKFTGPDKIQYNQPGFYYQGFSDQIYGNNEWYYPSGSDSWKVRFAPNQVGTWTYQVEVTDASGTYLSSPQTFTVTNSTNHGFIKRSIDERYFEYDDGTYFPSLGMNLNGGRFDWTNPVLGNQDNLAVMGQNGIQLSRIWIQQGYLYAAAWSPWRSLNPLHQTQEPNPRIAYKNEFSLDQYYPNIAPDPTNGSEIYLWLNADKVTSSQWLWTPCLVMGQNTAKVPVQPSKTYHLSVKFRDSGIVGGLISGNPAGFAIKTGNNLTVNNCNSPTQGTVLASTWGTNGSTVSPDQQNPGWSILKVDFTTTSNQYFMDNIYLTVENATIGHVFVDSININESLGGGNYGPNVVYKPDADQHTYINQRTAYSLDKIVEMAENNGVYLKPVVTEKNDMLQRIWEFDGTITAGNPSQKTLFYGDGRNRNIKTRFLQEAWWRYIQARWGYSTNIHSWELLNEGPEGNNEGHWTMTDEFGKYMQCRVFDKTPDTTLPPAGIGDCTFDHPNAHMVTTSFWAQGFPYHFLNQQSSQSNSYPDFDYADWHNYPQVDQPAFYDAALNHYTHSMQKGTYLKSDGTINSSGVHKPVIRAEMAWDFEAAADVFATNTNNAGEIWVHNWIWAGLNPGGLIEHFWYSKDKYKDQMVKAGSHDHRPVYKTIYNFVKDIPLNNGHYNDAFATVGNPTLRAWGQKDLINDRAHLWIQNSQNTWKNKVDGISPSPITSTVTIPGLKPNTSYPVEWWNTYTGEPTTSTTQTTNGSGVLTLNVTNLTTDTAVRIGNYDPVPTPASSPTSPPLPSPTPVPGDANGDGYVNIFDYSAVISEFGANCNQSPCTANFNGDETVDIFDYSIVISKFGFGS